MTDLMDGIRREGEALAITFAKGEKRDAVRDFYKGSLGEFEAFRDEFRNDVMHVRASYDELQALRVGTNVLNFLERLAKKTNENGRRIRWK